MKPLSVEMTCLLGIQDEIQAVWHCNAMSYLGPTTNVQLCRQKLYNPTDFNLYWKWVNSKQGTQPIMAIPVVEFSNQGYKIRKIFA